jgi:hypothetical protein
VWKARIHLELGVVLGICPPGIGPLNLRLAVGIRVLLLILQLREVYPLAFFSKDEPVLLKYRDLTVLFTLDGFTMHCKIIMPIWWSMSL